MNNLDIFIDDFTNISRIYGIQETLIKSHCDLIKESPDRFIHKTSKDYLAILLSSNNMSELDKIFTNKSLDYYDNQFQNLNKMEFIKLYSLKYYKTDDPNVLSVVNEISMDLNKLLQMWFYYQLDLI
jgi:hypothetical protein